jgi:CBS domain-containing protein
MEVRSILASKGSEVVTLAGTMPAAAAAQLMSSRGIGAIVVSSDGVTLQGLLRESEIVGAVAKGGGSIGSATVADLMVTPVPTCEPGDHVKDVTELMTRTRIRHLPVVDAGRICGLLSVGDLLKHRLDEVELESRVLRYAYRARQ